MKKSVLFLMSAALMLGSNVRADEQPQVPNGDFETWTYDGENLPNNWNSFQTADGTLASMGYSSSNRQVKRSTDVRPGSTGQYSCAIWARSILGIVAQGNLTSGRIHAGSMSAANKDNYNYTDRDGSNKNGDVTNPCAMPFTGKPKAVKVWVKYVQGGTGYGNYATAKFSAIIHGDADYISYGLPENDTEENKALVVASAVKEIEYKGGEWEELEIPFEYTNNGAEPAYIQVNASTNAYPGKGKANDYLYIDDIELVYYTKNLQDAWIEAIADQTYTGKAITPTVTVKDGNTTLVENTDYTVSYSHNEDIGTATVTVTAVEGSDYSGTATATFFIRADKTALSEAITEAEKWYEIIKESNPVIADNLLSCINGAKDLMNDPNAMQESIDITTAILLGGIAAAQADVAQKRISITIPAKGYVARVDADKRKIETTVAGVSLYSVKSVTDNEVELTAELSVVKAEMPYLIFNDNDEEVTVSIVVSTEDADNVEYDDIHFKGTLTDKTFTDDDMQTADHYVLTGKNFVWVKDAGTLNAGKCWIELIPASPAHARELTIVAEGGLNPTGINAVSSDADITDGNVYDLSGHRVAQPGKGLFIVRSQGKNGKKVMVK